MHKRHLLRLLVALAMALGVITGTGSLRAQASVCTPWPGCIGTPYQVSGTPDDSLWEWSGNPSSGGTALRSVANGYTLWVTCQANNGPQEDGKYNVYPSVPATTWDFAWDSGLSRFVWVYDWWMNTPQENAADSWYSWPDAAHHCNFGAPPSQTPPAPTNVAATATTSGSIRITWRDNSGGAADYVVSNANVSSPDLPAGTTSYDWPVAAGTYMCFTVTAKENNLQSPWSAYGCATTPSWCPASDATLPTCSPGGAFQMDCNQRVCSSPTVDNDPPAPEVEPGDGLDAAEAAAAYNGMGDVGDIPFIGYPLPDAQKFFGHYIEEDNANAGSDLDFDVTVPYRGSTGSGSFSATVNDTVNSLIRAANGGTGASSSFDSGWADYAPVGVDTTAWNDDDWRYAVGHGFYRVTGTRQSDGSWSVSLQLTSYYQFRDGVSFGPVSGTDMRRLEAIGWAANFDEVGTGTLLFNSSGQNIG